MKPRVFANIRRGEPPHRPTLGERIGAAGRDAIAEAASHAANRQVASTVVEHLEGDRTAASLLESLSASAGDGDELLRAAAGVERQPEAWRRGFWRRIQKRLEAT